MTQPSRISVIKRQHAALWYGFGSYRLAWTILPQALVALAMAAFFLGSGFPGISWGGGTREADRARNEWAKPVETEVAEAELNKMRDAAADNSDPGGIAVLEKLAEQGNSLAAFKLGTLFDPILAGQFPYPTQKDPDRALKLFQPSADEGFFKSFARIATLRLSADTPQFDPIVGCDMAKKFLAAPEVTSEKRSEDDIFLVLSAADCYAGLLIPKGATLVLPTAEDAKKALELYAEPLAQPYSDPFAGQAHLYLTTGSPVYDVTKGCEKAKIWIGMSGSEQSYYKPVLRSAMIEATYCILGVDGRRSTAEYRPALKDEETAVMLLSMPLMEDYNFATSALAWFYLNTAHALSAPKKGCDTVQRWAAATKGATDEIDALSAWSAVQFASCLLATAPSTTPLVPSEEQRMIGRKMLENRVAKNDPEAQNALANLLDIGMEGIPQDQLRALSLFQSCAAQDLPNCHLGLGDYKRLGLGGIAVDIEAALREYRLCAAQGVAVCHALIVNSYQNENATTKPDPDEMLGHLKTATDGGDGLGMILFATATYNGNYGLKSDHTAAAIWYVKSFATNSGRTRFDDFETFYAEQITSAEFWKSFHAELKRRGVYDGKIASKMTRDGLSAAGKLVPQ